MSFIDPEKINQLIENVDNALRPLGLTLVREACGMGMNENQVFLQMVALVRDSAADVIEGKKDTDDQFNKMMSENAKAKFDEETEKIKGALSDPNKLMDLLFSEEDEDEELDLEVPSDECSHVRHPEGFCINCGKGLK